VPSYLEALFNEVVEGDSMRGCLAAGGTATVLDCVNVDDDDALSNTHMYIT